MRRILYYLGAFAVSSTCHAEQFEFSYPPPKDASQLESVTLWSTQYRIHTASAIAPAEDTVELRRRDGTGTGLSLRKSDWCNAAMEGTVAVLKDNGAVVTFNVDGLQDAEQVDCSFIFRKTEPAVLKKLSRQVFAEVSGARIYGLGTNGYRLVPFRTVAVDQSQFSPGTVFYIEGLRGKKLRLPDGTFAMHDGYVFAGDKGGSIVGNHIDFFSGIESRNPAPEIITSNKDKTFKALIVTDEKITSALQDLHQKK